MLSYTLKSKQLSQHLLLQRTAIKATHYTVKKGDRGTHVTALQMSLNRLFSHYRAHRIPKTWRYLKVDGVFGENTFAAVRAFQEFFNRRDLQGLQDLACELGGTVGSRGYKNIYSNLRSRLSSLSIDGIVGFWTLFRIDSSLIYLKH